MAAAAVEEYRCFVGGLAWATNDGRLSNAFASFGDVVESKVISDRETGKSRGFGFVTFREEKSMMDAIESMNGKDLDGRSITVHQAQQRPSYNRSNDGSSKFGNERSSNGGGDRGERRYGGDGRGRYSGSTRPEGRSDVGSWKRDDA